MTPAQQSLVNPLLTLSTMVVTIILAIAIDTVFFSKIRNTQAAFLLLALVCCLIFIAFGLWN